MEPLRRFEWKCPVAACKYVVSAYSESGCLTLQGLHLDQHKRERAFALGTEPPKPPKDLNVLELTVADKAFLKTRYIKYD